MRALITKARLGMAVLTGLLPAAAHHSYSMFDRTRTDVYSGVVRIWELSNPHSYLWIYVPDAANKMQLWGIEAPAPNQLGRGGLTKNSIQPGDHVTIRINPLRDGRHGGNLEAITLANGQQIDTGNLPGATGGAPALNNGPAD